MFAYHLLNEGLCTRHLLWVFRISGPVVKHIINNLVTCFGVQPTITHFSVKYPTAPKTPQPITDNAPSCC